MGQDEKLVRLYQANKRSTAYLDESFETDESTGETFFLLGCVTIADGFRSSTREALQEVFPEGAIHASPMWKNNQYDSLEKAARLAAEHHDGLDIVVQSPLGPDDPTGDKARLACIRHLAPELHRDVEVDLFVFDKPSLEDIAKRDARLIKDLVKEGLLGRSVAVHHAYPSHEPLLGLPDILAWSYRQVITRADSHWFKHFEGHKGLVIKRLDPPV
ncbi:hypothetical protein [Falsarthrobacter nasiphocae]|uniref:DUF3800 domain-containing protein n=1 Tax=Falsarthrobacter nasiphocae TaxID=189863 RepID=A0AAE3YI49_9MICC|nr:hypothetical protein [Falsarthrobacter nasiphocae]MDR6892451.1 hypothetical protein [Falsarthrobacter nasiphocae]